MEQRRRTASKFFPVYQPALNLDFRTGFLPPEITFSRASTATFVGSNGLIQTAAANTPRFNYNPALSAIPRLLVEAEARTNLTLRSAEFDNASWIKTAATIAPNGSLAPDGTVAMDKLVEDTANSTHYTHQARAGSNETTTSSVYAKAGERTRFKLEMSNFASASCGAIFDVSTGTVVSVDAPNADYTATSATIVNAGNGIYRCTLTVTKAAVNATNNATILLVSGTSISYLGDGASGLFLWGAQLEIASFVSSYIPTTSAAVTRAADIATVTGGNFGKWFNPWTGTFAVKGNGAVPASGLATIFEAGDGTYNNRSIGYISTTPTLAFGVTVGGVQQANIPAAAYTANASFKLAASTALNQIQVSANGTAVQQDASSLIPVVNALYLGRQGGGGGGFSGELEWLRYWQQDADPKMVQYLTSSIYD